MRAVASRTSSRRFNVRTRTAVGGVRGTDFIMEVIPDERDALFVEEGSVYFQKLDSEEEIIVESGQGADTYNEEFAPQSWSADAVSAIKSDMDFTNLDPADVPRDEAVADESVEPDEEPEAEPAEDTSSEDAPEGSRDEPEDTADTENVTPTVVPPGDTAAPIRQPGEQQSPTGESGEPSESAVLDGAIETLGNYLNMEIGSITMGGDTYGKVILQPKFELGKFKAGLYLPVIYSNDLFNPSTWYQPDGNNEWSFGTDDDFAGGDDEAWLRVQDFWQDLWLKIRYVGWGEQRDPFFFQAGNISSMTLGHGILMNRYANDTDFPQVRRVGLNLGLDPGRAGLEFIANDLAKPEILGARFFVRPAHPHLPLALGISAAADINPGSDLSADSEVDLAQETRTSDIMFYSGAADIDIPIMENSAFSLVLFGDAGGIIPYIPTVPDGTGLTTGFQTQAFYKGETFSLENFRNYGLMSGVFGSILAVDYRLEYRNFHGIFSPLYDETYDRYRSSYAVDTLDYLLNPAADEYQNRTQGIYGEAGFAVLNDALDFTLGYLWPWDSLGDVDSDDYLHASLLLAPDLLPLGIGGGIEYTRSGFVQTLLSEDDVNLFDAKTTLDGEISYPVAPGMSIAVNIGTAAMRDNNGNLVYDEDGKLRSEFSLSLETRIGY